MSNFELKNGAGVKKMTNIRYGMYRRTFSLVSNFELKNGAGVKNDTRSPSFFCG